MVGAIVAILRTVMDEERLRLMTAEETAEVLACSTKSIYRLLDSGRVTPLRPLSPGRPRDTCASDA